MNSNKLTGASLRLLDISRANDAQAHFEPENATFFVSDFLCRINIARRPTDLT